MNNALQIILTVIQALQAASTILSQVSTMVGTAQATGQDLTEAQLQALDDMVTAAENMKTAFPS